MMEPVESRTLLSTYTVTNANDSGAGSLRQAITDANKSGGADVIKFKIGSGAKTISPTRELPGIKYPVTIDGASQPGFHGKPLIELSGGKTSAGYGLKVTGSGTTIKGLRITDWKAAGILLYNTGGSNKVVGNWIGLDSNGTGAEGNKKHGIMVQGPNNVIGGTSAADRNVISGNGDAGVFLFTYKANHTTIKGNYIGTDYTGSKPVKNKNGVHVNGGQYNTIGGTTSGSRNVLSGNVHDGVLINTGGATHNVVQGNYIGTNAAGAGRLGNGWYGVEVSQSYNTVGGTSAAARNVISANGMDGVSFYLASGTHNVCQGNYIGTDYTGTRDLGNAWSGISITNDAKYNTIGGSSEAACNVIAGNDQNGIGIYNHSTNNTVQNNCIGITAQGKSLPNGKTGVLIWVSTNNKVTSNDIVVAKTYYAIHSSSGVTNTTASNTLYGQVSAGLKVM
jgi:hypothetical protein